MRIEETINAASGILETMTQNKVQKTQKAFAAFMDNAVQSSIPEVSAGVGEEISATVSDKSSQPEGEEVTMKNDEPQKPEEVKADDGKAVTTEEKVTDEVAVDEAEIVAEVENAIISMLAQQMGISVEEVTQKLEELGMSALELLDSSKLLEFTMAINGVDDISVVLTDENFVAQYKELTEEIEFAVENVMKENNVSVNELPEMIENVAVEASETVPVEVMAVDEDVETVEIGDNDNVQSADNEPQTKVVVESGEAEQDNSAFTQQGRTEQNNVVVGAPVNNHNANVVMEGFSNVQQGYATADVEQIINQVVEQIKVQVNADTSSMEMQLNPETFGKLQLHVALKDGVITAQMAVENENVRQALEAQVVQLRETMNNQGLKVEAVEVTIASHEFDRNLQQESNANQQAFEEEQQKASVKRMNLNLNDEAWLEDNSEQLTDAEALERKIMLESGNRMSIQA